MTAEEALQVILASEGENPLRMMLEYMVQTSLDAEMNAHPGAVNYERSQERTGYRNGHKPCIFTVAVATSSASSLKRHRPNRRLKSSNLNISDNSELTGGFLSPDRYVIWAEGYPVNGSFS